MNDESKTEADSSFIIRPSSFRSATPTPKLDTLLAFRSVHPLYAAFLVTTWESPIATNGYRRSRVCWNCHGRCSSTSACPGRTTCRPDRSRPPGSIRSCIQRGLIAAPLPPSAEDDEEAEDDERQERPPALAEKLLLLFDATYPDVNDVPVLPVWAAGELLRNYAGNFNLFVKRPRPDQAGRTDFPPPFAADPAVRRVPVGVPGGNDARRMAGRPVRYHRAAGRKLPCRRPDQHGRRAGARPRRGRRRRRDGGRENRRNPKDRHDGPASRGVELRGGDCRCLAAPHSLRSFEPTRKRGRRVSPLACAWGSKIPRRG